MSEGGSVRLENPEQTAIALRQASSFLSEAHAQASEREGDRTGLIGPIRDIIFGLNTAVESLAQMIEEGTDHA